MKLWKILKKAFKSEFSSWKWFEVVLLVSITATITAMAIVKKASLIAVFGGLTGIMSAVFGSKGKVSSFVFATISQSLYAYIAFNQPDGSILISAIILAFAFYIPSNVVGFIKWFKHRDENYNVLVRRLSLQGIILTAIFLAIVYTSYSLALYYSNVKINQLWLDSAIMWSVIFATVLYIFRYIEQWAIWFTKNVVMIIMWTVILISGKQNSNAFIFLPTFIAYLLNAMYGFINWTKLHKSVKIYKMKIVSQINYNKFKWIKKVSYNLERFFAYNPSSLFWNWKIYPKYLKK